MQEQASSTADPDRVGVWWQFNSDAGGNSGLQSRTVIPQGPTYRSQCLSGLGRIIGNDPFASAPMNGRSGAWWPEGKSPSGLMLVSYFLNSMQQHVLLYFQNSLVPSLPPTPRWAHAVSWDETAPKPADPNDRHSCFDRGYALLPGGMRPGLWTDLCMLDVVGYPPDGSNPPVGGWNYIRDQYWAGTLSISYDAQRQDRGGFSLMGRHVTSGGSPRQTDLPINDTDVMQDGAATPNTNLRRVRGLDKRISVHRIYAEHAASPGGPAAPIADERCSVHATGVAAGYCDLRLHWITNQFLTAAVYMHRLQVGAGGTTETGERVLVRDSTPITPGSGYALPPRAGAAGVQNFAGIPAGETYRFELYRNRQRADLLATTGPITGLGATGCASVPEVTAISPANNQNLALVNARFQFRFTTAGTYRVKLLRSPTLPAGAPESLEFMTSGLASAAQTTVVPLSEAAKASIGNSPERFRWVVQSVTPCGLGPERSTYFYFGEPDIPDAAQGPDAPSEVSDTDPLVGQVDLQAGVDGGGSIGTARRTLPGAASATRA